MIWNEKAPKFGKVGKSGISLKIEEAEPFLRQLGRAKQLPAVENVFHLTWQQNTFMRLNPARLTSLSCSLSIALRASLHQWQILRESFTKNSFKKSSILCSTYYYYYSLLTLALSSCCLARSSKSCLVISRSRSSSNDKSLELSESLDV
ncbi:hypothetical protein T03_11374 [Trichinella britovi]|uniref:Uncharacterized protein n=1 Tax=Trichinella britovi TaxID=45882 RepID=A0A0V1D805_TRIBR|nr:hypothetical protein T03_11374 [Trichinella britovi]